MPPLRPTNIVDVDLSKEKQEDEAFYESLAELPAEGASRLARAVDDGALPTCFPPDAEQKYLIGYFESKSVDMVDLWPLSAILLKALAERSPGLWQCGESGLLTKSPDCPGDFLTSRSTAPSLLDLVEIRIAGKRRNAQNARWAVVVALNESEALKRSAIEMRKSAANFLCFDSEAIKSLRHLRSATAPTVYLQGLNPSFDPSRYQASDASPSPEELQVLMQTKGMYVGETVNPASRAQAHLKTPINTLVARFFCGPNGSILPGSMFQKALVTLPAYVAGQVLHDNVLCFIEHLLINVIKENLNQRRFDFQPASLGVLTDHGLNILWHEGIEAAREAGVPLPRIYHRKPHGRQIIIHDHLRQIANRLTLGGDRNLADETLYNIFSGRGRRAVTSRFALQPCSQDFGRVSLPVGLLSVSDQAQERRRMAMNRADLERNEAAFASLSPEEVRVRGTRVREARDEVERMDPARCRRLMQTMSLSSSDDELR